MLKEFKRLHNKYVKIVYKEGEDKILVSEGILCDINPSFVCVRGANGLVHYVATSTIVRISERFAEIRE